MKNGSLNFFFRIFYSGNCSIYNILIHEKIKEKKKERKLKLSIFKKWKTMIVIKITVTSAVTTGYTCTSYLDTKNK